MSVVGGVPGRVLRLGCPLGWTTFTPVTTISDTSAHTIPDRVGRRVDQGALNRVWTFDITYLATGQGWLYLCAVRDGHSRRVIGYAFAETSPRGALPRR